MKEGGESNLLTPHQLRRFFSAYAIFEWGLFRTVDGTTLFLQPVS